jgi:lysyl-tRNA synthetase class 2
MSPLAKSFIDPDTGHLVSARAELFVNGVEYANMYEEENDPFAQTQKFLYQAQHLDDAGDEDVGERPVDDQQELTPGQKYYVKVLEMGLPPTGGWGAGIERLVMLFGGAKRIGDVLPFGTVRGVVAMGTELENQRQRGKSKLMS